MLLDWILIGDVRVTAYLELVRLAMLDQHVDKLSRVLHEVDVLIHGPVHDQQSPLLVRKLAYKVEDAAQLISCWLAAGTAHVPLRVTWTQCYD